jgi:hemolysin D
MFVRSRRVTEQDFLPAVLEVMEKPPSPAGRAVGWTVMMFSVVALIWAFTGKVDIVLVASGQIVPSGRIKAVQAAQLGIVRQIHVVEGQQVMAGAGLIELDPSVTEAEQARIAGTLQLLMQERRRLSLFSDLLSEGAGGQDPFAGFESTGVAGERAAAGPMLLQHRILVNQWSEFQALKIAAEKELEGNLAEQNGVRAGLDKLRAILPLVSERVAATRKLVDQDLAPRMRWSELEQQRVEAEKEIGILEYRQQQLHADADRIRQEYAGQEARLLKTVHTRLAELDKEIAGLEQELAKAEVLMRRQQLTAPVSGTVHRMAVHTVGGVVKPAEPLMYIVPDEAGLEVEAWIKNRDIGFVEHGQDTEIKVETFPFTRYGTIPGRVASVSQDAVTDAEHGLVYRAKIILQRSTIEVGERMIALAPGMAVTAELKTGRRKLIEFLVSPLLRYKNEFARER